MGISREKETKEQSKGVSDFAIFFAVCWIVAALLSSSFFGVHWLAPGDFGYSSAMYYHGIMIPVLILLYLLTQKVLPLRVVNERAYTAGAILSILFVGFGSIFNTDKGISIATVVQVIGMVMTDFLGIILVTVMAIFALRKNRKIRKIGAAFWLLFSSIIAILMAAPLGHLAGWYFDIGIKSIPGPLNITNITPDEFRDGLVASHSHLTSASSPPGKLNRTIQIPLPDSIFSTRRISYLETKTFLSAPRWQRVLPPMRCTKPA